MYGPRKILKVSVWVLEIQNCCGVANKVREKGWRLESAGGKT